jgi:CDP-glucose 4,6-dehydratase
MEARVAKGRGVSGFWAKRRVLLTGHTGFKGAWLALWLRQKGADVHGLSLTPNSSPSLFDQLGLAGQIGHRIGDIRAPQLVADYLYGVDPEVVFHLAAQPLVRHSYRAPLETWETNVMGTVHLLEAVRVRGAHCAVVVVTTDKVYENKEWVYAYREEDRLGGHDPYSASKVACELAVDSFRRSFLADGQVMLASARSGNVIGGGDWSEDRILPDLARALARGEALELRNPHAIRPWQHVLDSLAGYMNIAERLWGGSTDVETAFNFGPDAADRHSVRALVEEALGNWPGTWREASDPDAPHEAGQLSLATDKARAILGWAPRWGFEEAVRRTVCWYREVHEGADPRQVSLAQIAAFEGQEGA